MDRKHIATVLDKSNAFQVLGTESHLHIEHTAHEHVEGHQFHPTHSNRLHKHDVVNTLVDCPYHVSQVSVYITKWRIGHTQLLMRHTYPQLRNCQDTQT